MDIAMDPAIAFRVSAHDAPALEVRVNFGVYAGRNATRPRSTTSPALCAPSVAVVHDRSRRSGTSSATTSRRRCTRS